MKVLPVIFLIALSATPALLLTTTADRVRAHGYASEEHTIQTTDGYRLTVFRMQRTSLPNNQMASNKSVVLLQHCLLCTSDMWILNGPNDALPYLLADKGYDVWMGNSRGNSYSQGHVSYSPLVSLFWDFSFHEVGKFDVTAMIDYITGYTGESAIHYVGHSEGSTAFFVTALTPPSYAYKIKTAHLLAPLVFMENMESIPFTVLAAKPPSAVGSLIGTSKFVPTIEFLNDIAPYVCTQPLSAEWCNNILFFFYGSPTSNTNYTLFGDLFATHPSSASVRSVHIYAQGRSSAQFKQFDFGPITNLIRYGSVQPPQYNLASLFINNPVHIYYADNDGMVPPANIVRLANTLGFNPSLHNVADPLFSHLDFLISTKARPVANDCIVDKINQNEGKPFTGNECTQFKN